MVNAVPRLLSVQRARDAPRTRTYCNIEQAAAEELPSAFTILAKFDV